MTQFDPFAEVFADAQKQTEEARTAPEIVHLSERELPEVQKEVTSERRDSCSKHLGVDWNGNLGWHNRGWVESDFKEAMQASDGPQITTQHRQSESSPLICELCGLDLPGHQPDGAQPDSSAFCTCTHLSDAEISPEAAYQHDDQLRREARIQKARRQLLFGGAKVNSSVALAAAERLKESEDIIENVYVNRDHGSEVEIDDTKRGRRSRGVFELAETGTEDDMVEGTDPEDVGGVDVPTMETAEVDLVDEESGEESGEEEYEELEDLVCERGIVGKGLGRAPGSIASV